jgi:hypothetical protein
MICPSTKLFHRVLRSYAESLTAVRDFKVHPEVPATTLLNPIYLSHAPQQKKRVLWMDDVHYWGMR